eukprot:PhM_4_TR17427/c1_g2_i8/m.87433
MSRFGSGPGVAACLLEVLSHVLCPPYIDTENITMVSASYDAEYCLHVVPASADLSVIASQILARDAITFGLQRSQMTEPSTERAITADVPRSVRSAQGAVYNLALFVKASWGPTGSHFTSWSCNASGHATGAGGTSTITPRPMFDRRNPDGRGATARMDELVPPLPVIPKLTPTILFCQESSVLSEIAQLRTKKPEQQHHHRLMALSFDERML